MLSAFCLSIIAATALFNIYAHWIDDGLLGRLVFMGLFLTCGAGLIHIYKDGSAPLFIWSTLLVLVTLSFMRSVCVKSVRYIKYRRLIHAKNSQR